MYDLSSDRLPIYVKGCDCKYVTLICHTKTIKIKYKTKINKKNIHCTLNLNIDKPVQITEQVE